jgi:hypothetical protein
MLGDRSSRRKVPLLPLRSIVVRFSSFLTQNAAAAAAADAAGTQRGISSQRNLLLCED